MNTSSAPPPEKPPKPIFPWPWLVVLPTLAALLSFLLFTPPGFLTKADMVCYAVCHQWKAHSFVIAGRQLSLCARCTGTFLGALVGLFGQAFVLRRRRAAEFPSTPMLVILIGFMLLWAIDGLNSFIDAKGINPSLDALIRIRPLYEPQNWLRLTTGALNGLTMSALIFPVFNFTLWRDSSPERSIRNLRDLAVLVLLEGCLIGLVLLAVFVQQPFVLYPLAFLSAMGILTLLTLVNSLLVLMFTQRDNMVTRWREAVIPIMGGFMLSLVQIGVIDFIRYLITGTLSGIPLSL
jgi:uncharacterized membrane protein